VIRGADELISASLGDSTGIKMLGEGEWKTKKHGADYGRQWRKVHLGIDAATLEIRAIEVSDNATGDAPIMPCLLDQIPATRPSRASAAMVPMTPKAVNRRSRYMGRRQLSPLAGTPSHERTSVLVLKPATPSWRPRAFLAGRSGRSGAAITGAALSRPRCVASRCLGNASWHVTSTARSPNCSSAPLSSIGSPG